MLWNRSSRPLEAKLRRRRRRHRRGHAAPVLSARRPALMCHLTCVGTLPSAAGTPESSRGPIPQACPNARACLTACLSLHRLPTILKAQATLHTTIDANVLVIIVFVVVAVVVVVSSRAARCLSIGSLNWCKVGVDLGCSKPRRPLSR
jgi:hypothetical protein